MLIRPLRRAVLAILIITCLAGCASTLDYNSPTTVDLTGTWVLDPELSQVVIFPIAKSSGKRSRPQGGGREGKQRGGRSKPDGQGGSDRSSTKGDADRPKLNRDATLATEMIIEQAVDSMGVMYQNGKYREVDWGEVERRATTITSGWAGETLVIKSKGARTTLSEFYTLNDSRDVLTIKFDVAGDEYFRVYNLKKTEALNE